jgi:hypothetical protein
VEFSSHRHFYKLSHSWLLGHHSYLLSQAQLVYLQSGRDSPTPTFGAQCAPPSLQSAFIVLIACYSVSLLFAGGGRSVQWAMLIWPRVVSGSTAYHLAHLVCDFPSHLGVGVSWPRGPSWVLCLT